MKWLNLFKVCLKVIYKSWITVEGLGLLSSHSKTLIFAYKLENQDRQQHVLLYLVFH